MKKLVLFFFEELFPVHLKKDVGLFPIYLKKYFDEIEIVHFGNHTSVELPDNYREIKLIKIGNVIKNTHNRRIINFINKKTFKSKVIKYIKKNKDITHIMMFHFLYWHIFLASKIKKNLPNIKIYLKLDTDQIGKNVIENVITKKGIRNKLYYKKIKAGLNAISLITIESNLIKNDLKKYDIFRNKLFFAPNGYDDALLVKDKIAKEKIIITVGRLGSFQKNTELFLKCLEKIDLQDWKVYLIGSIEDKLNKNIDMFYSNFPEKKNNVFFYGSISNTEKLTEIYSKASVFVLTSRYEGSALVLIEAAMNGCYILSTDVGSVRDISTEKNFCFISPESHTGSQNEEKVIEKFSEQLSKIIHNPSICYKTMDERLDYYRNNFLMSSVINNDFFREFSL